MITAKLDPTNPRYRENREQYRAAVQEVVTLTNHLRENKDDIKAQAILMQHLDGAAKRMAENKELTTAHAKFTTLNTHYISTCSSMREVYKKTFEELKMGDTEDPVTFLTKFKAAGDDWATCGHTLSAIDRVHAVLSMLMFYQVHMRRREMISSSTC